jgi:hypothetical protein
MWNASFPDVGTHGKNIFSRRESNRTIDPYHEDEKQL